MPYQTIHEASLREVVEVIALACDLTCEQVYEEFDVVAIVRACIDWHDAYDATRNVYLLNKQGYYLKAEYGGVLPWLDYSNRDEVERALDDVDAGIEAFWDLVRENQKTP